MLKIPAAVVRVLTFSSEKSQRLLGNSPQDLGDNNFKV